MNETKTISTPEEQNRQAWVVFGWFCVITLAVLIWIATHGLHLRIIQIVFLVCFFGLPIFYVFAVILYWLKLPLALEKLWPKPRLILTKKYDLKCMAEAKKLGHVLIGYDGKKAPIYWSENQRSLQTNLPGKSGSGKTTLLMNIIEQDIRRGHPLIYFDGKGDKELVMAIQNIAYAAGRGMDVKVLDPTHPEISSHFNPFYAKDGRIQQRVSSVFESLGAARAKDEFFAEHQRAFLSAVTDILQYTGKHFTFWDVLVACQSPQTMSYLINSVKSVVMSNPDLQPHQKNSFMLACATLRSNYEDKDWLTKIRGLLNSMMPFVGDSLALITGSCHDLVTFEEIVEKKQILVVTMNLGADSHASKALGRILMRNLQFMISCRYDEYRMNKIHPFMSVVLDEFGLYAYQDFKNIIHTARQANAALIFSFQNLEQLAQDVSEAFSSDMANAPNNNLMMHITDERTAKSFLQASALVPKDRLAIRVERANSLDSTYTDEGTGTRQEVLETRVQDRQIKMLPTGQMMAMLPDPKASVIVKHIFVRRACDAEICSKAEWLPELLVPLDETKALNLHMTDWDIEENRNATGPRRRK